LDLLQSCIGLLTVIHITSYALLDGRLVTVL
jgi:hypothetical protein